MTTKQKENALLKREVSDNDHSPSLDVRPTSSSNLQRQRCQTKSSNSSNDGKEEDGVGTQNNTRLPITKDGVPLPEQQKSHDSNRKQYSRAAEATKCSGTTLSALPSSTSSSHASLQKYCESMFPESLDEAAGVQDGNIAGEMAGNEEESYPRNEYYYFQGRWYPTDGPTQQETSLRMISQQRYPSHIPLIDDRMLRISHEALTMNFPAGDDDINDD